MKFKHKYIHKFYAFALAAVFALTLAGCGGGGGSATAPEPPMTGPTDAERIADAQTAAMTAAGVAAASLAAVEANKSADLDSYIRASIANDNAQAALEAAMAATTPAAAEAAQADAEAASADAQKYAGMVTTAHNAMEAARMELMALNDAQAAAMKAYMDAKAALDAIADQGDADSASYDMAVAALAAAMVANDAAQAAETSADAEAAQANAEAALADARKYAGMVTAAHMEATALSTAQGAAMQAYMDAKAALAAAAANREADPDSYDAAQRALGVAEEANMAAQAATTSEAAEAAQADVEAASANAVKYAGMVNQAKADADAKAAAAAEAAAAKKAMNDMVKTKADAITAESTATPGADSPAFDDTDAGEAYTLKISHKSGSVSVEVTDPALPLKNDPKFVMMDGKYVRDNGKGVSEIVSVMTDIEAPESELFSSQYTLTVGDADPERTGDQRTTYELDETADVGKVASSRISSAPTTTTNLPGDDTATDANEGQFKGTFDGASGTYECIGTGATACTATTDEDGKITAITGEWQFKPDAGAMVSVADDDYLHYGFWLMKTVKDGKTTYNTVQTFAGSSLDDNTNIGSVVAGNAKYEGGAHGVYVYNTVNPDASLDTRSAGTFTADVALTAYFGTATSVAADKHNSVHGTISNFELSGGEANEWEVTMATVANVLGSATIAGTSKGMATDASTWSGTFYGDGADNAPPPVLVGEFNSNFSNGAVAGAFGTRYMKE